MKLYPIEKLLLLLHQDLDDPESFPDIDTPTGLLNYIKNFDRFMQLQSKKEIEALTIEDLVFLLLFHLKNHYDIRKKQLKPSIYDDMDMEMLMNEMKNSNLDKNADQEYEMILKIKAIQHLTIERYKELQQYEEKIKHLETELEKIQNDDSNLVSAVCSTCTTVNEISRRTMKSAICINCGEIVLSFPKKKSSQERVTQTGKKCIYCNNPVASYSKMVCKKCYQLNSQDSIRFRL